MAGAHQLLMMGGGGGGGGSYNGTVTFVYQSDFSTYEEYIFFSGSFGSASPTTMTDGKLLKSLSTYYTGYGPGSFQENLITVSGFSSDPGASYLHSITVGGVLYSLTGATYAYSAGNATWHDYVTPWFFATGGISIVLA